MHAPRRLSTTNLSRYILFSFVTLLSAGACRNAESNAGASNPSPGAQEAKQGTTVRGDSDARTASAPTPSEMAALGKSAPDFQLSSLDGNQVTLSEHRGKIVVLEWFNPGCPFVKAAHTNGSLIDTAEALIKKGVVYLAVNSGGPGKQGHSAEENREAKTRFDLSHPILLDEEGVVGRKYGATNTPHLFVVDKNGILVYRGAVDNSPDGEGQSPQGGTLVNYLTQAVDELLDNKPVSTPESKAYGCSVKYSP